MMLKNYIHTKECKKGLLQIDEVQGKCKAKIRSVYKIHENLSEHLTPQSAICNSPKNKTTPIYPVYLVGAGPGDVELITLKALKILKSADIILYDTLINPDILNCASSSAESVNIGKATKITQLKINQLIVKYAQDGKKVVRLKGGDTAIFSRAGEEIDYLYQHNISVKIIPGITAASAAAAALGIPLTHRDLAGQVCFVTGRLKGNNLNLQWDSIVATNQTLVVYMGLEAVANICGQLIKHGMDPAMPAILIENASYTHQRNISSSLDKLPTLVSQLEATKDAYVSPSLIIIGDIVRLSSIYTVATNNS